MGKKKITKNLANCTPREFLTQTNKIRKAAAKWLTATDIMNIRKNAPKLKRTPSDADPEEVVAIMNENKEIMRKAAFDNFNEIYNAIAEEHPDETLELLALLNFVELSDLDDISVSDLIRNTTELLNNEEIVTFFTSLTRLGNLNTLNA